MFCYWLCFSIANSHIQTWRHLHLPITAINMDEFDTDTWGWLQNVSRAPIDPNKVAHKLPCLTLCLHLKESTWSSHAWYTEYHIKLAPIADHRVWDQFNKQNLVYRFMGPIWQPAKTLAGEFCAVSIWFHKLGTNTGSNFFNAVFRVCTMTLPNRLSTLGDPSPSISVIRQNWWMLTYPVQYQKKKKKKQ